jgi:modulator of FtsH protease
MTGYEIEPWHDFFVAQAGAGAALTGLVFVAISINLTKLLAQRAVQGRAVEALMLLVALLIVGLAALIPGQGARAFGIELIAFGIALSGCVMAASTGKVNAGGATRGQHLTRIVLGQMSALAIVLAGASLLIGAGGGLYWLAGAAILCIVAGMIGAWVLLVEILR